MLPFIISPTSIFFPSPLFNTIYNSSSIRQHTTLSVSLLIHPNDFSYPGFLDLIYVLVNRKFRSFHSIVLRVIAFIKGIMALKDSLQGTFVYSYERLALPTCEKAVCVWACMHSVLSVCHYAPLPCVNATWH